MLFFIFGTYKNVVQITNDKGVQEFPKYVIHQILKDDCAFVSPKGITLYSK